MTDKEFRRLSRSQLIEIIYQFQLRQDELIAENERLTKALEDKRIRMDKAGNIAEAALAINNVMQDAQNAAQQYLYEIRTMHAELDAECQSIRNKAKADADAILAQAHKEAAAVKEQSRRAAADAKAQGQEKSTVVAAQTVKKTGAAVHTKPHNNEGLLEAILSEYGNGAAKK